MCIVNGWTLYAHPLLLDPLETLITVVEKAKAEIRRAGPSPPKPRHWWQCDR